ncbi:MAG: pilus assembly protein PilM [Planctomycetaceae bacterium]|jgi:hypothetical protein|nr:pilus assembly protein PilM [Planctomycetaceae bacterium]
MSNLIAITWENDRLLFLSAAVHNNSATFEHAESLTSKNQLKELVQKYRLAKSETIVVLSRADVEVRSMVFPPVPVNELPDLVKFQATKEFNGYDAAAPLDFFITNKLENVSRSTLFPTIQNQLNRTPLKKGKTEKIATDHAGSPKHLLASTLRIATLRNIREFCDELNLILRRVVLRPCETAYLWRHTPNFDPNHAVLVVELDTHETSQTVLFQGEPVFMRSPKISCPDDVSTSDFAARLVAELKRTRIAVRNEIQGVTVDEAVLCGVGANFESLAKQVANGLGIPVKTFDPWQGIRCGGTLQKNQNNQQLPIEKPERFASLIGTILQSVRNESSHIDFCNPKKRREPVGHRQLVTGGLAVALVVLTCLIVFGFYSRTVLTSEVKNLTTKLNTLKKTAGTVSEQRNQLNAIDAWIADNVNWFEQLDWLSRKMPTAQEMILTELTFSANSGGSMNLRSLLKDFSVVSPMEEQLRDENHVIKPGEKGASGGNPQYSFRYDLSIFLSKESADASTQTSPPEEQFQEPNQ